MLAISGLNMMLLPAVRLQVSDYSYLYDYTVRLQLSVRLHCPITAICTIHCPIITVKNAWWKITQVMHQSHLRKL